MARQSRIAAGGIPGGGRRSVKPKSRVLQRPRAAGGKRRPGRVGRRRSARRRPTPVQRSGGGGGGRQRQPPGLRKLQQGDGCAAIVGVTEHAGRGWETASREFTALLPVASAGTKTLVSRHITGLRRVCRALAAVGHLQRGKILLKLLEGPGTYQSLRAVTGLKAGPLYHHVNQLRLAGLVLPKQRDLYELTRGGRNLIVAAMALEPLTQDTRRRPFPAK